MLEVILSDFANLKTDTEASEAVATKEYSDFMIESKKSTAVKEKSLSMTKADKVAAEEKLLEDTTDLKLTQDKLIAAEKYYEKLEPKCIDKGMTFEERTKAREEEITSLKEALKILEGDAMLLQTAKSKTLRGSSKADLDQCYCGCCSAHEAEHTCHASIGASRNFATNSCRAVFCTADPARTEGWNNQQWNSFCSNSCLPKLKDADARAAKFDARCRPAKETRWGVGTYKS